MVKVIDASMPDVRKALQGAGIEVRSILLVNKETIEEPEGSSEEAGEQETGD
jgi:hypothetical protein